MASYVCRMRDQNASCLWINYSLGFRQSGETLPLRIMSVLYDLTD